jgi:ABC-type phosphate transport system auxiliary subunit
VDEAQITAPLKNDANRPEKQVIWGQVHLSTVQMWISGAKEPDIEASLQRCRGGKLFGKAAFFGQKKMAVTKN